MMPNAARLGRMHTMWPPARTSNRPHGVAIAAGTLASFALLASVTACESGDAHLTSPRGGAALSRFVVVGSDLSMGAGSGGVVSTAQGVSWPALVAAAAGVTFRQPLFRVPGCTPPLVAPLFLGRWLSGAPASARDSSCAGAASADLPPADNLALAGATAWAALNFTPKLMGASPAAYAYVDRARYPVVLGSTQSQVTAMLVKAPTFVSLELGTAEVLGAATSGRLAAASSYTQADAWTYVPAAVAAPVVAAIADSIAKSGARAVILSVPRVTKLPAFRTGSAIAAQRTALVALGVTVAADCDGSANLVNVAGKIPPLVLRAIAAGTAQVLSCADSAGAADQVLLPADAATLDAVVDQLNVQLRQLAQAHGWAFADLDSVFSTMIAAAGTYSASAQMTCVLPYGRYYSLDGLLPSAAGQALVADAVTEAINDKYRLGLARVDAPAGGGAPTCAP